MNDPTCDNMLEVKKESPRYYQRLLLVSRPASNYSSTLKNSQSNPWFKPCVPVVYVPSSSSLHILPELLPVWAEESVQDRPTW